MTDNKKNKKKDKLGTHNPQHANLNISPDFYTKDLNKDKNIDEGLSKKATTGLNSVTDEGVRVEVDGDHDDIDVIAYREDQEDYDRQNITTDSARFTDTGGTVNRGSNRSFTQENVSANAGTPGHWGVDEDTA
jgi:hypothetical protein